MRIKATNAGTQRARLHVLLTLWFRNTWSWDEPAPEKPRLSRENGRVLGVHETLGTYALEAIGDSPDWLFCDNETHAELFPPPGKSSTDYPKDAIARHVMAGDATNPDECGTKAAGWYQCDVDQGASGELVLRLHPADDQGSIDVAALLAERQEAADAFYNQRTPGDAGDDEAQILRQAFAGL